MGARYNYLLRDRGRRRHPRSFAAAMRCIMMHAPLRALGCAGISQRTGQGRFSAYSSAAVLQAVQYGTAVQYGCTTVQYGPVLLGSGKVTIVTFWRQGTRRALVRWGSCSRWLHDTMADGSAGWLLGACCFSRIAFFSLSMLHAPEHRHPYNAICNLHLWSQCV
eukprot:COSAG01_NODE_4480_length_4985_cov_15.664142_3_plen_164_part_00